MDWESQQRSHPTLQLDGKRLVQWDQFQVLINQTITRVGRVRREQFLRVYTYTNGNEGVVVVEDFHPEESLLDVAATVTGPNNFQVTQPFARLHLDDIRPACL